VSEITGKLENSVIVFGLRYKNLNVSAAGRFWGLHRHWDHFSKQLKGLGSLRWLFKAHQPRCCCCCCCTAAIAVAGPNDAEVPQGRARKLLSVHLQKQLDEGGSQERVRLEHIGRQWLHGKQQLDAPVGCRQ
jgi:hypothetical protein